VRIARGVPAGAGADGEIVARLRAAGTVVVGLSRVPELCSWASADTAEGIARDSAAPSTWPVDRPGGSAAAVAAGMVPLAHDTDALGSIRGPAAICGALGIMRGAGVVPAFDPGLFCGLYRHGALATTAAAALLLAVLAQRSDLGANLPQAPANGFLTPWNRAGYPALSVPPGRHPSGTDRRATGGRTRRRATVARPRRAVGVAQGPVMSSVSSPAMAR
jgi:Asp-tRNA(Asn)/Glu-tRNA(Gln) amidotransferase A subunit family amidase